jgi:hypothetical protein
MEETMRAPAAAAVRNAFHAVLNAMPEDKLRTLILELLLAGLSPARQAPHRKRGRPPKAVEEENAPLQRNTARRRRKGAVDEAKLAERRKRYAAKRKAKRQAAKAAAAKAAAANANGQDVISAEAFWRHAEKIEPKAPWKPVMREFGTNEGVAKHAFKSKGLPPHVGPVAVERFLAL